MSKDWYQEMMCEKCHKHMGYYTYAGPGTGCGICIDCYNDEPDSEEEDDG